MINNILTVAILLLLLTAIFIAVRWRNLECRGNIPTSLLTFIAILFTSGLDVGLIMFPLTEFPIYASETPYQFTNPLAVSFGFWGFMIWSMYFVTTFYFCVLEPHLQLFKIPIIKWVNNIVVICTCAFTGFLFLSYLPNYIEGISPIFKFGLVATVVMCAVLSSTNVRYVRILSVASTWLFFSLIATMWLYSDMGFQGFFSTSSNIGGYFQNLHQFIAPITDYHAFYLFWWLSWSIMIGQFVSRFVGGIKAWQLLLALLFIPSIPIAVWFSVLYYYHSNSITITQHLNWAMVTVGIVFVINSLDSLIRLYNENLGITVNRMGKPVYIAGNWICLFGLILLYQFTPFKIEWVGLIVIALYIGIYRTIFSTKNLSSTLSSTKTTFVYNK